MRVLKHHVHKRMSRLVPCGAFLFLVGHRKAAAFAAPANLVARLLQFLHADGFFIQSGGEQGGFIQ